ncbi:MAG: PstS family phosphate ABC transporter substrate-binding protein [Gemmatimonadota bacterium]
MMTTRTMIHPRWAAIDILTIGAFLVACGGGEGARGVQGSVQVDGSSTVYPITEAVAEEFLKQAGNVRVTVGISGTGGGFKRFCAGETDISDASRPIKPSEAEACAQNGVEFVELPVAYDGLSVLANPRNAFCDCLTVAELKRIWEPGSTVRRWSDVRPEWPNEEIHLYGPGTDSGTFDYFTEAIVGKEDASRPDFTASEDDNVLVQGVEGDASALGYFGYAYYIRNEARLKLVGVDDGSGCVKPSPPTIEDGTYAPLSRPIFIYVSRRSLVRPEVAAFVRFYMEHAPELVPQVGYIALAESRYQENLRAIESTSSATD